MAKTLDGEEPLGLNAGDTRRSPSAEGQSRSRNLPLTRACEVSSKPECDCVRSGYTHKATWHWLWRETVNRLDSLQQRANEGKDLDAAVEFARYVLWSKLDEVLKPHDCDGMLKVDASFLRWKAEELQRTVTDAYRRGNVAPRGEQGQLDAIARKLDLIAGHVAKISVVGQEAPASNVVSVGFGDGADGREAAARP